MDVEYTRTGRSCYGGTKEKALIPQSFPGFVEAGFSLLVPKTGLEPAQACAHKILNLACLPIPPLRQGLPLYHDRSGSVKRFDCPLSVPGYFDGDGGAAGCGVAGACSGAGAGWEGCCGADGAGALFGAGAGLALFPAMMDEEDGLPER